MEAKSNTTAAIYSRKSIFTGKGESIENQIQLCKEYGDRLGIKKYLIYEDEAFSGGNTNRPKFQQLIKDAENKKFDVLICYRLDRISRNVADFSSTLELLEKNNISFISISEQFDTATPMGRAMVYIASVFAQLERETIAERVRDNMLQLAKTGRWLGGQEPFGYTSQKVTYLDENLRERSLMKLIPIDKELRTIELIYSKYLEFHSISQVVKYLNFSGIKSKNGGDWAAMQVKRVLSNPLYVKSSKEVSDYLRESGMNVFGEATGSGYLTYNKTRNITRDRDISEWIAAIGKHPGVIESSIWLNVQHIQEKNKAKKLPRLGTGESPALLTGILKCEKCGANMIIKHGHKSSSDAGERYDYYVCSRKNSSYGKKCNNKNIRVDKLDKYVVDELKAYNKELLMDELSKAIKNETDNNPYINHIKEKKQKIFEKETGIDNLIKQLTFNSNEQVAKRVFSEIGKLNNEVANLKTELRHMENSNDNFAESANNTNIALDSLKCFGKEYDMIKGVQHKRNLLRTVVDYITWNGDEKKFKIKPFYKQ